MATPFTKNLKFYNLENTDNIITVSGIQYCDKEEVNYAELQAISIDDPIASSFITSNDLNHIKSINRSLLENLSEYSEQICAIDASLSGSLSGLEMTDEEMRDLLAKITLAKDIDLSDVQNISTLTIGHDTTLKPTLKFVRPGDSSAEISFDGINLNLAIVGPNGKSYKLNIDQDRLVPEGNRSELQLLVSEQGKTVNSWKPLSDLSGSINDAINAAVSNISEAVVYVTNTLSGNAIIVKDRIRENYGRYVIQIEQNGNINLVPDSKATLINPSDISYSALAESLSNYLLTAEDIEVRLNNLKNDLTNDFNNKLNTLKQSLEADVDSKIANAIETYSKNQSEQLEQKVHEALANLNSLRENTDNK